jgi:hypothetical protein
MNPIILKQMFLQDIKTVLLYILEDNEPLQIYDPLLERGR